MIITRLTFSGVPKRLWQAYTKQTFVGPNCSHVAYNLKTLLCCGLFVRSGDPQSYICLRVAAIDKTDKTAVLPRFGGYTSKAIHFSACVTSFKLQVPSIL